MFAEIPPHDIDAVMHTLASEPARVYSGRDADGNPIFRKNVGQRSGVTLNRYQVALFAWAKRQRLVPRGFDSPTRRVEGSVLTCVQNCPRLEGWWVVMVRG
ncbi:MAG: hypothetical protein LDL16_04455 [Thiobacillus sp.]|nr:hypothetical protein [Thiobacillus sp.]